MFKELTKQNLNQVIEDWFRLFEVETFFSSEESSNLAQKTQPIVAPVSIPNSFSSLGELRNFIMITDLCGLKKMSRNTVFADGDPNAPVMIIGEAPGEQEDIQGKPFVGQSGKLLEKMLFSVGLNRSDTYITNIVYWRPPGNRTPSNEEMTICLPYALEHIRLVKPRVVLLLGAVAAKTVLNTNEGITKIRGQKRIYQGIPIIPTYHPAYLLRSPYQKAASFNDMILMAKSLNL